MWRPTGSPNKLTVEIKQKLSEVIINAMSTLDIDSMIQNERLKLIQIGPTFFNLGNWPESKRPNFTNCTD